MIRWTNEASEDFESIRDYIAADSPAAAARQCDLILEAIAQIDCFPESGRRSMVPKLRQISVPGTPSIIFYRLYPDAAVPIDILHEAMRRPLRLRR